jgi:energy-coupling factor transport system permease protein
LIRDITLGQYVITKSPMHRLDPRIKLVSLVFCIVFLFLASNFISLAVITALVALVMALSGVGVGQYFRSLRAIIVLVAFTSLFNVFYGSGEVLVHWGPMQITVGGIRTAILVVVRIVVMIFASAVLTFTTTPNQLTDGLERLLSPLSKIRVPVHEIAMMMTIAIRFIPTLLEETNKIMSAQKSRGADLESGNLLQRAKALVPILIPLFVSSFRRAFDLAQAMEARCYNGGSGRTKMRVLRLNLFDWTAMAVVVLFCAATLFLALFVTNPYW